VGNDAIWKRFCELVGRPELVEDARFSTNGARNENWQELEPILKEIMSKDSTEGWIERLRKAAVPCGPINNIEQVVNDPQVRHRQMIVEVEHPVAGKFKMPGCPLKLSATPAEEFSPAPVLGADLESVLVEYAGMTPEEIEDLRKRGIA